MRMQKPELLKAFVEHHEIPFLTSTMAKGMIDEDHRLSIGCIERGRRQIQRKFIQSSDLIIGLGFDTIEVEYEAWIGNTPLLSIDIEDPDIADSVNLVGTITGNITTSLEYLLQQKKAQNKWTKEELAAHVSDSTRLCAHLQKTSRLIEQLILCVKLFLKMELLATMLVHTHIKSLASGRHMILKPVM